ncbi:MAG: YhbY family RNA-binding protein [Phycisphaerae bacterium]|jgi:RNA-binding protein
MSLSAKERKALIAAGHHLKAGLMLSPGRIDDGAVAHVRAALADRELVKVRVRADERSACEETAAELVARVPCELVQRVGRVLLLYRPPAAEAPA